MASLNENLMPPVPPAIKKKFSSDVALIKEYMSLKMTGKSKSMPKTKWIEGKKSPNLGIYAISKH